MTLLIPRLRRIPARLLAGWVLLALWLPAAPAAAERVIVALGDSLTAGLGVPPGETYPARLEARLRAAGWDYRVVNAGVSGDTTAGGLRRLDRVLRARPEIVLLVLGANDGLRGHDLPGIEANLDRLVERAQAAGARVLLGGMRLPPNYGAYAARFHEIYGRVAARRRVALMPFFLDGVAADPRLNQADGLHPNGEGYRLIVERLWPYLLPLLRR